LTCWRLTLSLILTTCMSEVERFGKMRDLVKWMEKVLGGRENIVTLDALNDLGARLDEKEEYEEAIKVYKRCLARRTKVLGEDHQNTLDTLNNLGIVYRRMRNYEKALKYYERALKGSERLLGNNHPETLSTMMNIAIVYDGIQDYGKAEELYERALEGREAQLEKDHEHTKKRVSYFFYCLKKSGNLERLAALQVSYTWLIMIEGK